VRKESRLLYITSIVPTGSLSLPIFQPIPRTQFLWRAPSLGHDFCSVFQLQNFNLQNFNIMDLALDHDNLVLFTCLLFPFGDGQVVSDVLATIAIMSSVLTMDHFTVVLPCVRAKLLRSRQRGNKSKTIRQQCRTLLSLRTEHGNLFSRAYRMKYAAFVDLVCH
jgi:hypothetical protein